VKDPPLFKTENNRQRGEERRKEGENGII